jgi:hypothetical protein
LAQKGESGEGSGDVISPANNTDSYIPQWDGADSKTLKNGLSSAQVGALATTSADTSKGYVKFANGLLLQWGDVTITPAANTPTSKTVYFQIEFSNTNYNVQATPWTGVIYTTVRGVSYNNRQKGSVEIVVTRTNTTDTVVSWLAIGY